MKKSSIPPPPQRPCPGDSDDGMGVMITGPPGSSSTAEISPTAPLAASGSQDISCPLYTSDAADDLLCVALGGLRITKKKNFILIFTFIVFSILLLSTSLI